jgi:uncharacterized protein (DUF2147 family)
MRTALTALLVLSGSAVAQVAPASAASPQDPSGTWLTGDGRAKVRIDRCGPAGANICGKVVWLKSPTTEDGLPRTDIKNPDPKKRNRPALGLTLLDNLKPEESKFSGEIYNADEGKVYQVSLERESAQELSVSGCLLKILCGSQTWTRVPDVNQQAANVTGEAPAPAPKAPAKPAPKPAAKAAPAEH